jgi:putative addiction module killer protein
MPHAKSWQIYRYADSSGFEPFSDWIRSLDTPIQRRVRVLLARIESGNLSSIKWLGKVGEAKLDTGPGYRIYLTRRGADGLVLLLGGDKSSQKKDIRQARAMAGLL